MKTFTSLLFATGLLCVSAWGQATVWKGQHWEGQVLPNGCLQQLVFESSGRKDTIPFFTEGEHAGPSFYTEWNGQRTTAVWKPDGRGAFRAVLNEVECRLAYQQWNGLPALQVSLINHGNVPFQPTKAGLRLGVDTYMDKYPDWFGKYFPTLLRNEKTHFYGYLQSPGGGTLGLVSPDPIASWSVDYNLGYQDPAPHWLLGHRYNSLHLHLMNPLPLPHRHPQHLWQLKQGETKSWTIALVRIEDPTQMEETLHALTQLPLANLRQTTFRAQETATFQVFASSDARIAVTDQNGKELPVHTRWMGKDRWEADCRLPHAGLFTFQVTDYGREAEGVLSAHATWQWTLERAREAALRYHQKATSHAESWYGFHSAFLAARYFPQTDIDRQLRERFDRLFQLLHTPSPLAPKFYASRIQNTSCTIGMLVDKYQAFGQEEDLRNAAALADWLIAKWQREDGAYMNHGIIYTSVIYVAKSILELSLAEQELGHRQPEWKAAAERHYASAKRAIDQLVASQGNFQTEGELTFEDGMISCSALQMGLLGLMQRDAAARQHYADAMLNILHSHDCLTQLRVPDARRRGGTLRFWEAQYDVQMLPNMFNSPHGWSGWRAYATYYAYLLTGEERWLQESYNATGAFSHLIDTDSGQLRWAFVIDPYLKVRQACSTDTHFTADSLSFGNPHPDLYETREFVIGEQYVNMISDWQTINTQDNDVHELFKFMGEAMLTNAFLVERPDGTLKGYNCTVERKGDKIIVRADEKQMVNLHCNLKKPYFVSFNGHQRKLASQYRGWAFGKDIYQP